MRSLVALLVAAAIAAPAAIAAHEGHPHKVMGTVTAIHENHVEVKDKDGKASTHVVDSKTKIRRGKNFGSLSDIKVGDRVVVTTIETKDKAGKAVFTVTQVDLGIVTNAAKQ